MHRLRRIAAALHRRRPSPASRSPSASVHPLCSRGSGEPRARRCPRPVASRRTAVDPVVRDVARALDREAHAVLQDRARSGWRRRRDRQPRARCKQSAARDSTQQPRGERLGARAQGFARLVAACSARAASAHLLRRSARPSRAARCLPRCAAFVGLLLRLASDAIMHLSRVARVAATIQRAAAAAPCYVPARDGHRSRGPGGGAIARSRPPAIRAHDLPRRVPRCSRSSR